MDELCYSFSGRVWLWKGDPSADSASSLRADSTDSAGSLQADSASSLQASSGQAGGWHFVSVDKSTSRKISDEYPWPRRGFGSIPVSVTVGRTKWKTSIFPDKDKTFVLPLKKQVRMAENIAEGNEITVILEVVE